MDLTAASATAPARLPTIEGTPGEVIPALSQTLADYPRRVPGRVVLDGLAIDHVDLHSFYWQFVQIFVNRLYDFAPVSANPLILDGGAHIGLASLYFGLCHPQAEIQAFEADPAIAAVLADNLGRARLSARIACHHAALWVHDRGMGFASSHDDSGHVTAAEAAVTVPTLRLRDILSAQTRPVDLLKLDVEGAEFALIEDCAGALAGVQRLIIEVHCLGQDDVSLGRLLGAIEQAGFRYGLHDLHLADWLPEPAPPPFRALGTGKFIITVFAWR